MNYKKIVSIILSLVIIMSLGISFADFSDVTEEFWGQSYIENAATKGILEGFDDGNFYPNNISTKLETILVIYKTMKVNNLTGIQDVTALVNKHKDVIVSCSIPPMLAPYSNGEVYPAVAYALENEIISESELKYFAKDGGLEPVTKIETTVYFGKALNLIKDENLNDKIISLDYKDQFEITIEAAKYVDLLISYKIIGAKGDVDNKFNPNMKVNRAILAVFVSKFDKALLNEEEPIKEEQEDIEKEYLTKEIEISFIHKEMNIIEAIEDGKSIVYSINDAEILLNESLVNINNLEVGMIAKITYDNDEIKKIVIEELYDRIEGEIIKITDEFTLKTPSFRIIQIESDSGENNFFKVFNSTFISKDDSKTTITNLKEGDRVSIGYEKLDAKSIKMVSKYRTLTGTVIRPIGDDKVVTVELGEGFVMIQKANQIDSSISRGDIVKLHLIYGELNRVESTGKTANESGTITKIVISKTPEITILTGNGESLSYDILSTTEFSEIANDNSIDIYDLRLDNTVDLKVNSLGVLELSITKPPVKTKIRGKITMVHTSSNIIEVLKEDGTKVVVGFSERTNLQAKDIEVGDNVYISVLVLSDELFEAENILIVE